MSLTKATFSMIDGAVVNVRDFGAKGDGVTDDTTSIQAAIDSISAGVVYFPPGFYKTSDTILLKDKNALGGSTQLEFKISAYGAKIVSSATGASPALRIDNCKLLIIDGLRIESASGATPDYTTSIAGMWSSRFNDCWLGKTAFGRIASAGFNSHYWNTLTNCTLGPLTIDTNTNAQRRIFNQNQFISCSIDASGSSYAIYKYGESSLNGAQFIGCDISYASVEMLYVDVACDGDICFIGGYFDSTGLPIDTKGLKISSIGAVQNPNSANLESFLLDVGSDISARSGPGAANGQRDPISSYNLIKNGSLRAAGTAGLTTNLMNTVDVAGAEGYFSNYKNFNSTSNFAFAKFSSIPAPFDGWYTLTVVGRNVSGTFSTQTDAQFSTISFGSGWTVSSHTKKLSRGDVLVFTLLIPSGGAPASVDIAYVGLNYGSVGTLGLIEHPDADLYSPTQISKGFESVAFTPIAAAGVANNTLFQDSSTGKLSFKDGAGVVNVLY